MTFPQVNPGGWALNELLTSGQMNALQAQMGNAVDGIGGGTYALTAPLIFTSDVVRLDSDDIDLTGGTLDVLSGASIALASGGSVDGASGSQINVAGQLNITTGFLFVNNLLDVTSGGQIDISSGAQLDVENGGILNIAGTETVVSTGLVNVLSGAELRLNSGADVNIDDVDDLTVNNLSVTEQWDGTPLGTTAGWASLFTNGVFRNNDTSTAAFFVLPVRVRAGDDITQIRVRLNGGAGAGHGATRPATMPTVELFRRNPETGAATSIAGPTSDPSASAAAYDVDHNVTLSGLSETAAGDPYFVVVRGETGANSVDDTLALQGAEYTFTARSIRATQEIN